MSTSCKRLALTLPSTYDECMTNENLIQTLHEVHLKATKARIQILASITRSETPLTITDVCNSVSDTIYQSTVFRNLETLCKKNLVRKTIFNTDRSYYEWIKPQDQHYVICEKCARVEKLTFCPFREIDAQILNNSKIFDSINHQHLTIYGLCKNCS